MVCRLDGNLLSLEKILPLSERGTSEYHGILDGNRYAVLGVNRISTMISANSTLAQDQQQGGKIMAILAHERKVYEEMRQDLEAKSLGKWVLIRDGDFVGVYDGFESAASEAVRRFGRGPYLIREIGAADMTLPASVVYATLHNG